ncbi:hypothetical protein D3C85_1697750 [compost metagenome]
MGLELSVTGHRPVWQGYVVTAWVAGVLRNSGANGEFLPLRPTVRRRDHVDVRRGAAATGNGQQEENSDYYIFHLKLQSLMV